MQGRKAQNSPPEERPSPRHDAARTVPRYWQAPSHRVFFGARAIRESTMTARRITLGIAAAAHCLCLAMNAAQAQDPSKLPDWSGQWMRGPNMGNGWDPTKPQGFGQQGPLTPETRAILEATLADKAQGGLGGDPTGICLPHGMPRM